MQQVLASPMVRAAQQGARLMCLQHALVDWPCSNSRQTMISICPSKGWTIGRVPWHHRRGEFPRFGYFGGRELQPKNRCFSWWRQLCTCIPQTDILLRYVSPEIDWELVGIDQRWREGVRVVFGSAPKTIPCRSSADQANSVRTPLVTRR